MLTDQERLGRARLAARRARHLKGWMEQCAVCPRECGVDRLCGEVGLCRTADRAIVASFGPSTTEEPVLSGTAGSGAVYFAGCPMRCSYCINGEVSQTDTGRPMESEELALVFLAIQNRGCHNLNLVTPTHVTPHVVEALAAAYRDGLCLPVVYNCSGYERVELLRQIDGLVDIYLTDFKYGGAEQHSQAPGYSGVCREAVREMHRQVGDLQINRRGLAIKGLMVRHLVLPGGAGGSAKVAEFVANEISTDTYCNVMGQYQPTWQAARVPGLDRGVAGWEVEAARDDFWKAGLHRLATPPLSRRSGAAVRQP